MRSVVVSIILGSVTPLRNGPRDVAAPKGCQDSESAFEVGSKAVVVPPEASVGGIPGERNGYGPYDYFMGVVGCFREEGMVCFEGIKPCFPEKHVHLATSAVDSLHAISLLAQMLERHFKGQPLDGVPAPVLLEVVNSRLLLASMTYYRGIVSTSPEAAQFRKFMMGVRTRADMIALMQPWFWRWISHLRHLGGGVVYSVDTESLRHYLRTTTATFVEEVRQVCVQPPGSTKCHDIEEAIVGLATKAGPILNQADDKAQLNARAFQAAVGELVDALADATGMVAELEDSLGDWAFDGLAQVRQALGRCIADTLLREPAWWDSLTWTVQMEVAQANRDAAEFQQSAGADAEAVVLEVSLLLPPFGRFLTTNEPLVHVDPADMGLYLKSVAAALRSITMLNFQDKVLKGLFRRLFPRARVAPDGDTAVAKALDKLTVKAERLEALLVAKRTRSSRRQVEGGARSIVEACQAVLSATREVTQMAVSGGATGFVRSEIMLVP